MTDRTWKLSKPEARMVGGVWVVDVHATARGRSLSDVKREKRSAEGVSFNLGDAITKAYWNLGEALK